MQKLELACIESNGQIQGGFPHAISFVVRLLCLFSTARLFALMTKPILPAAFSILYEVTFDPSVLSTIITEQLQK